MKIGYFADGPWSHRALQRIFADPSIVVAFICARSDTPDPLLREQAQLHGIDFLVHPNINSDEFVERVAKYECELFVSMSFNQIFKSRVMRLPRLATINCHAGKLPFYRGRNILNWALINDEREFGITVHFVDEGIDTGDIIAQRTFPITDADDYASLLQVAYGGCADLLYEAIKDLQLDRSRRKSQSEVHPLGFYCVARRPGDERLDWNQTSREVFNFVRALARPGPQARTLLGDAEISINRAAWLRDAPVFRGIAGSVVGVQADGFMVKTADSFVKVLEWSGASRVRIGDRFR